MYKTCHFEVFSFSRHCIDLTSNYQINQLEYPEGTNYDFDILEFKDMLTRNRIYISDDDVLNEYKNELLKNLCLSRVIDYEIEGESYSKQIVIILKKF